MATKAKKPTSKKKTKTPKPVKPKRLTILDTDLLPLREADELLTRIEAQSAEVKRLEIDYEMADDARKAAKSAMLHAQGQLQKLCDARKEPHPLFKQPAVETSGVAAALAGKAIPATDVPQVTVTIAGDTETHDLPVGAVLPIVGIKPGGILVTAPDGNATAIADGEYSADDDAATLIRDARLAGTPADWLAFVAEKRTPTSPVNEDWQSLPLDASQINGRGGKLLAEAGYETLGSVVKLMKDHGQWWAKEVPGIGEEIGGKIADQIAEFFGANPEYCQQ